MIGLLIVGSASPWAARYLGKDAVVGLLSDGKGREKLSLRSIACFWSELWEISRYLRVRSDPSNVNLTAATEDSD